jgi:DNA polymerase I-like protein with 3'-5' exonuclease and polymerase domains
MIEKKYYTVTDRATLELLVQHIKESDTIAFDTETNSLNPRKGKIIGFSVSGEEGIGFYMPTMVYNPEADLLEECMIDSVGCHSLAKRVISLLHGKRLVMHNASFDIRFTKNFYKEDLIPSLHADTVLLVHTVREEGAFGYGGKSFGLKEIAIMVQKEIGLDVETAANEEQLVLKESIKRNGGSITKDNYEIFKADLQILSDYAAADTDLTLRIFNHFTPILVHENLVDFFYKDEVMPIYKEVTIPMEEFGVKVDLELLQETKIQIDADLDKYSKLVSEELLKIEDVRAWILQVAVENYPPNNKGTYAQRLCSLLNITLPISEKSGKFTLNKSSISGLEDGYLKDFLSTGDEAYLPSNTKFKVSVELWKEENDGKFFNIQSKDQLGKIAFDVLGLKPLSTTTKGKPQFDDDLIESISKDQPWAENLRIYNKLLKIKSTYVDRFYERHEDGRYYFYFKQHGTVSGRYGSDMQQLPKPKEDGEAAPIIVHYNNLVRAFLVAEEGRILIDCDYESLEPHCFASVTGDENLREIFNKNHDFYSTVAIRTENLEGVSADKKADNFLKKVDPVKRNKAKAYSLGIAYGMESFALSKTLDISQKEAETLVNGYLDGFPDLKRWREESRKFVKQHGFITNKVGRIRHLPQVKKIHDLMGDSILDWKARKELESQYGRDQVTNVYRDYRNGLNNCLNYQLQSLAAAVVNRAAVAINRELKNRGIDGRVQAQVHDQLIINIPEENADEVAKLVQYLMENTTVLEGVTLKAPPAIAKNFRDGH